jgi:hypothetical protein
LQARLAQSVSLITGALPAQYGFRTAGIIDIQSATGILRACMSGVHKMRESMCKTAARYAGFPEGEQRLRVLGAAARSVPAFASRAEAHGSCAGNGPTVCPGGAEKSEA